MQRSLDESGIAEDGALWNWTAAILTIHAVLFLTLVGFAVRYPGASEWISAAMQAEFANSAAPPAAATQIVRPVSRTESVGVN